MDVYEGVCPRCKTSKYHKPSMKLMVNVCGHALCESCVNVLFQKGVGNCPECNTALRRNTFRLQIFEDPYIEKEVEIRKKVLRDFNKIESDFSSLGDYNDYLEEVETYIFNLANDIDKEDTELKIAQYKKENKEVITRNKRRNNPYAAELDEVLEAEQYLEEERSRLMKEEMEEERKSKVQSKESLIDDLIFSGEDANTVVENYKRKKEEEMLEKAAEEKEKKPLTLPKEFSSGIKMGRTRHQGMFLPVPKPKVEVLYSYVAPVITYNGPNPPAENDLRSLGYLENVRKAEDSELAGGFREQFSCYRVLQEAMTGMFYVPQKYSPAEPAAANS